MESRKFGRTKMFGFMILVAESGCNTFGQMFRHEIGRETGKDIR
jgi:hypothetical protein